MSPRYAELHCYSNFSFRRGASHPKDLLARAQELGISALAITDRNGLYASVRHHVAIERAQEAPPKPPPNPGQA